MNHHPLIFEAEEETELVKAWEQRVTCGGKVIQFFLRDTAQGSQAITTGPSDKGRMRVKKSVWQTVAS
jgi:hypothetical protein